MQILNEMTDNILIARLEGELDHHSAAEVRANIDETLDAFCGKHLIFCFSKVSFMDSAGIGVVMGRYNKVKENGGTVFVAECSEYVERILTMAGIFTIAVFCHTVSEAIEQCRKMTKEESDKIQD